MSIDNGAPQIPPPSPKPILRSLAQTNEPPPPLRPCTDSSGDARNVTLASDQSSTPDYALQSQFRQQREFLEGGFRRREEHARQRHETFIQYLTEISDGVEDLRGCFQLGASTK